MFVCLDIYLVSYLFIYLFYLTMYLTYFIDSYFIDGARCSSVVEGSLVVRWVVRSILHGGPIQLFLVPSNAPRLSCL